MRIVCQKCSAAYAIDDKFVTPKGVRAQCPRCRHLQLVKPGEGAAPPPPAEAPPPGPAGAPAPFAFDFSAPPPPGGEVPPPPAPPTGAPPAGAFDFSDLAPPPAPSGKAPAAASGPAFPGGRKQQPAPPTSDSPFDFSSGTLDALTGNEPPAAPAPSGTADYKCRTCGKQLTDAFDQALGTCDDCRNKAQEGTVLPPPGTTNPLKEHVEVRRASQASLPQVPATPAARPSPPDKRGSDEISVVRSALRNRPSGAGKNVALVVVVLLAVGAVVGLILYKKPWLKKPPPLAVKATAGSAKAIDAMVQQWRLNYPDLSSEGSKDAAKHLELAEESLQRDTTQGYIDAREEFEKTLVLDSSNDRAIGGWVLTIAFGQPGKIDDATFHTAESLLTAGEQRSNEGRLYVAHAHLLIARGANSNDIKSLAEQGKTATNAQDKALAALALGQALLTSNPQSAEVSFNEALKLDPKLKRGYFFQAAHAEMLGRYKDAIDSLEKRLVLDPDQWEAAARLARIYVEVGEIPKAKKVLEKARSASPQNAQARMQLAVLSYQHLGDIPGGLAALTAIVEDKDLAKRDLADAWVHLSAAARASGDIARASEAADRALELAPESVPAKLQRLLGYVEKGVNSQARLELEALKGKLGDPGLEGTIEGRLLLNEARYAEAAAVLSQVYEQDGTRADALLLAGVAYVKAKNQTKGWESCLRQGLKLDPNTLPLGAMTSLWVRPSDLLRPAVGVYAALVKGQEEDPNPSLCEGLIAYFSEDLNAADRHFARVNAIDPRNVDAFSYRSIIALKRKDVAGALKWAGRAVDASRTHALAWYALGAAQLAAGKPDLAKPDLVNAQKYGPQLLAPRVLIADIEARQKSPDEARKILTSVLLSDPNYREAKRLLYKHGL